MRGLAAAVGRNPDNPGNGHWPVAAGFRPSLTLAVSRGVVRDEFPRAAVSRRTWATRSGPRHGRHNRFPPDSPSSRRAGGADRSG